MAAQFVFFYLTAVFYALSKPTVGAWMLAIYVVSVVRSIYWSRRFR